MKSTFIIVALCSSIRLFAQEKSDENSLLKELSENACKCIDSINVSNKTKEAVANDINRCIDNQTGAYQLGSQLMGIKLSEDDGKKKSKKKKVTRISLDMSKNSEDYKKYYYEMERYLMDNCKAIKEKIASNDMESDKSVSKDPEALAFYSKGLDQLKSENYEKATEAFQNAVRIDPQFSFAWDNLGISYRKLGDYDKALEAYKKSLEIDPTGLMPLQNIAIVYQYKKEYQKAVEAYEQLAKVDKNNPEVYYGAGRVYAVYLSDYEKGLDNLCIAYNLYVEQKSPYRSDAEQVISYIYGEMKKQGKEKRFTEILKEHHINQK